MRNWVILITCVLIVGIGGSVYFENTTSGLMPTISGLLESEYKPHYVKTESDNYKQLWNGKYRYTFVGYAEDGKKQEIVRVMDRVLRSDAYLRMYAEGSLGKYWEEVQEVEIPEEALSKLKVGGMRDDE
jgi:uncharacterized protein (TIGR01655 family)